MATTSDFPKEQRAGRFERQASRFRDRVRADGTSDYAAAAGRYHLYVSLACPWAHRTVIVRRLKGLEDAVGLSVVDPIRDERGWRFGDAFPDPLHGWDYLSAAYTASDPAFEGRITVPVLWDKATGRIVNNESADIVVDLATQFDAHARRPELDLYPEGLRPEIDELNAWVYETVNNGVYRAGFATTQEAYEEAVVPLFESLDRLDERLGDGRAFLFGDDVTLADVRLFTTLVRFDPVYVGHFKCNLRRIVDYPHLQPYLRRVFALDGVGETVDIDQIKRHYYVTHRSINPTGIVPLGPVLDL